MKRLQTGTREPGGGGGATSSPQLGSCLGAAHPTSMRNVDIKGDYLFLLVFAREHGPSQKIVGQTRGVFGFE